MVRWSMEKVLGMKGHSAGCDLLSGTLSAVSLVASSVALPTLAPQCRSTGCAC